MGCPELGPFDVIHVGAAAEQTPTALIEQLANGGRLLVPVGPEGGEQYMQLVIYFISCLCILFIKLEFLHLVRQRCKWICQEYSSDGRHVCALDRSAPILTRSLL